MEGITSNNRRSETTSNDETGKTTPSRKRPAEQPGVVKSGSRDPPEPDSSQRFTMVNAGRVQRFHPSKTTATTPQPVTIQVPPLRLEMWPGRPGKARVFRRNSLGYYPSITFVNFCLAEGFNRGT